MALHGSIDSFPIVDVLRLLASTAKTGRLTLDGDRGQASVWFDGGSMIGGRASAGTDGECPIDGVVFDLLRFDSGSFAFDADDAPPSPSNPTDVESTIAVATAQLDELRDVTAIVPGLAAGLRLAALTDGDEVRLDRRQWSAVVAIGSGASVAHVGAVLGLGELDALRTARLLHDAGIVEVSEAAPEIVAEPVHEPVHEPVAEIAPEPVAEPVAEVAPEPVAEPVAEVAPEPVVETVTEPEPEPVAAAVTEAPPRADEVSGDDLFTAPAPGPFDEAPVEPAPEPEPEPEVVAFAMPPASTTADANGSSLDELFGEFDPFGQQGSAADDDLFAPMAPPSPVEEEQPFAQSEVAEGGEESIEAQLAMLSPAAADAIAAARRASNGDGGDNGEAGREAVSNYLGNL